jgi:hypothetical protein
MIKTTSMETARLKRFPNSSESVECFYLGRLVGNWLNELHAFPFRDKNDAVDSRGESMDSVSAGRVQETRHFGFYSEHNTQFYQQFGNNLPAFSRKIAEACQLKHPIISMIRQDPGQVIPWHQDSFYKLRQKHQVSSSEILRCLIFLEDWKTGHYFQIAEHPLVSWKQGDIYMSPPGIYHLSGNCGLEPKFTAQVSGLAGPHSLHLHPAREIIL